MRDTSRRLRAQVNPTIAKPSSPHNPTGTPGKKAPLGPGTSTYANKPRNAAVRVSDTQQILVPPVEEAAAEPATPTHPQTARSYTRTAAESGDSRTPTAA